MTITQMINYYDISTQNIPNLMSLLRKTSSQKGSTQKREICMSILQMRANQKGYR